MSIPPFGEFLPRRRRRWVISSIKSVKPRLRFLLLLLLSAAAAAPRRAVREEERGRRGRQFLRDSRPDTKPD